MAPGSRMCRIQLWLLLFLVVSSLTGLANGSSLKVMSAPNVLRVGTPENIFVECQDCSDDNDIKVEIIVLSYPTKSKRLASTTVTLTKAKFFQGFGQIKIPANDFSKEPNTNQYVYLQAHFPDAELEKLVLVSFQSGYIYIQTDKTLYTPNSKVHYRMFGVTPRMEPMERDNDTNVDASIAIDIVTPEGIIIPFDPVSLKSGIHSGHYKLIEIASIGLWKVVAKFHSKPQLSYTAEFEVKEYVLPSFEVKLTLESPFFYVDSEELTINIKATYLFGEEVDGTAYGVFGVMYEGQKRSLPSSLQRVTITHGTGEVKLKKEHIRQTFQNILDLVGSSLFVAVGVLTETGSEMVEAELRGIKIVTSPYTIQFKRTPKYFKPAMSFDVVVEVMNPDGTPAQGVPVVVDPGSVRGLTAANGMARLSINTQKNPEPLTVTAKTNDPGVSPDRQASANMTALPYSTSSNSYINIVVDTAEVTLEENLKINFILNKQENRDITYLILSRGQLVKYGHYGAKGQQLISRMVTVTKDMLPSFRIIAYYHTNDNEVVSDSIWVDAEDSCMGSLKLESSTSSASYEPRKMFGLKVTGDPEAIVGLVAVDKAVYVLNNKHNLNQKKVWDMVETYDTGCTPGSGKDGMSVFYDAGLLFQSNTASGTPSRQEPKCPAPSRRKRTPNIMDATTSLAGEYVDQLQRDCCLDGMRDVPVSYTCDTRSEYIVDGPDCVEAFLYCCKEMETLRAERKEDDLQLARSEIDDSYLDSDEIVSRTKFPESWLWSDIKLPPCPQNIPNCDTTSIQKDIPLTDTITTWQFTGISLSRTHGICVAKPLEVIVRKDFFIDLKLPYSAVRGEQIEVKAILYNYSPDVVTVHVDLMEVAHVCSSASRRRKYSQRIKVGRQTTQSVPFVIIPTKEGEYPIEVKAAVKDSLLSDGVMKMLRVVPEGLLVKSLKTVTLDPVKKGDDGKQVEMMNSRIPTRDFVPYTPTSTQVSVTGSEQAMLKNDINGKSMGSLIYEPSGCGEENMIHMTLPVIATTYLDKTNQWEPAAITRRAEALKHISTGYRNQLAYRKSDGSFAMYHEQQSSTWLTAFVAKVFSIANNLVEVQSSHICDAVKFLIVNTQQPNGMFREIGTVSHREMMGEVQGIDRDASMTAFCLIAMQESRTHCGATVDILPGSIDKAVAYLEKRLSTLTNPYAVAIASYALANENKLNREILLKFATPELSHWQVPMGRVYTLEATAYALLALVKAMAIEDARPVVRWFNKQRRVRGGYGSTQATLMVYQAVFEYWTSPKGPEYDLNVDILFTGRSNPVKYKFNMESRYATRTSKVNDINQNVKVTATGIGQATVTMLSLYYALPQEKESDCQKFNMSVQLIPEKMDEHEKIYRLRIKVLFKDKDRDATMSVLDIGLLTGFTVNTNDLSLLSKGRARTISKYMLHTESGRGSLIIHLDKVSHTRPEEISFRVHQTLKVGVLQPAAVTIYEYNSHQYNNQTNCVKFYHPERRAGELLRLCKNDECTCAEENCSLQKKGNISNDDRTAKACETQMNSKIDFVYKVRLQEFTDGLSTDIYTVRVLEVIKEGSYDVDPLGKERTFLSYPHCRISLDLGVGKNYLVMGTSEDFYRDERRQLHQYILGERTWIEYWPTEAECQTEEHRPICLGMEKVRQYRVAGCQQ